MNEKYQELLDYWFDKSSDLPTKEEMRKWFLKSRLYDNIITEKFHRFYQSEKLNPFPATNAFNTISKDEWVDYSRSNTKTSIPELLSTIRIW